MSENILKIKDLSLSYEESCVVSRLNLDVKKGELLCIVGESGSGKSTLLRSVCGDASVHVNGGCIIYDDRDVVRMRKSERQKLLGRHIGYIQQNPYGACWGFAAISAAESSLIADGLADENVDLSEKHVSYFAASYLDDPSNSQNGEGMHYRDLSKKDLATSAYKYDVGGTFINATSLFSSGIGPVSENAESSGILKYMGKNGEKIVRRAAVS